jgi:putative sterol carrier protein
MVEQMGEAASADLGARGGGRVEDLAGVSGRLAVEVDGKTVGELVIDDGHVELGGNGAPTQGVVGFKSAEDLWKVLRGQLNPVVASLQGRLTVQGDLAFAVKVILCISAASPFTASKGKGA